MPINYNPETGYNIPETLESYYRGWKFSPSNVLNMVYVAGSPSPADYNLDLQIKDFIAADIDEKYDSFLIKWFKREDYYSALPDFVSVTGELVTDADGYALTTANQEVSFVIDFSNFQLLQASNLYREGFRVEAYGLINGQEYFLEKISFDIIIDVVDPKDIRAIPNKLIMSYLEDGADPAPVELKIYTNEQFYLGVVDYLEVTGEDLEVNPNTSEGFNGYIGTGSQTLTISLIRENLDFTPGRIVNAWVSIQSDNVYQVSPAPHIVINQLAFKNIKADPRTLSFAAVRNIFEADYQEVEISTPDAYTVTLPDWMESLVTTNGIKVKPVASANFRIGTYAGEIKITSSTDTISIFVGHRVVERADFNLTDAVTWCRDQEAQSIFYSADQSVIAALELEAEVYDTNTGLTGVFASQYALAFYQNKAEFHIGDVIKRLFVKPDNLNRFGLLTLIQNPQETRPIVYAPPVKADIIYSLPGEDLIVESITDQYFLDGRKPAHVCDRFAILRAEPVEQRVTRNGFALVNFYRRNAASVLKVCTNGEIEEITLDPSPAFTFGHLLRFSENQVGDKIQAKVTDNTGTCSQKFIVYPDAVYSNHLVWVNEYQCQEIFEFTGEFRIETEYQMIDFKRMGNLVEYLERVDTRKEQSLIINTGWLPKSNQILIDEMIMSKKAWLICEDLLNVIELLPKSKKLTNEDSENATYAYDVEFTINKAHDLKSHTSTI